MSDDLESTKAKEIPTEPSVGTTNISEQTEESSTSSARVQSEDKPKKKSFFDELLDEEETVEKKESKTSFSSKLDQKSKHNPQFSVVNFNPDDYKNIMDEFENEKKEKKLKEKKVVKKKSTTSTKKATTSSAPAPTSSTAAPKRPAHNARITTAVAEDLFKFVGHEKQESVAFDMNSSFDMKDFINERKKDLEDDKGLFDD